jgi:anti-sigma B factor antagonist
MAKDVQFRQDGKIGFLDFPRDVIAQTRESAYAAYNQLAVSKVEIVAMNFDTSDYLNSAGIGLVISLVEDANRAGRRVFAYGLSSHYRKLFSMVGLTERLTLVASEQVMREKLSPPTPPEETKKEEPKQEEPKP